MDKATLRKTLRQQRAAIPSDERAATDARIADTLFASEPWQRAHVVLPYLSFGAEVDTRAIIERAWEAGKLVALPRVVEGTRDMRWYEVESFEGLEVSPLGIEEPAADANCEVQPAELCQRLGGGHVLVLVPGLAFDRQGYRMGYGGGFYDTLLSAFPGTAIGLCRSAFLMDDLPCREPHDLPVQAIATEAGLVQA